MDYLQASENFRDNPIIAESFISNIAETRPMRKSAPFTGPTEATEDSPQIKDAPIKRTTKFANTMRRLQNKVSL